MKDENFAQKKSEVLIKKDYEKLYPIIKHLEEYNSISPKESGNLVEKAPATVRRYMGMLVGTGMVVAEGSMNNVTYVRKKEDEYF